MIKASFQGNLYVQLEIVNIIDSSLPVISFTNSLTVNWLDRHRTLIFMKFPEFNMGLFLISFFSTDPFAVSILGLPCGEKRMSEQVHLEVSLLEILIKPSDYFEYYLVESFHILFQHTDLKECL